MTLLIAGGASDPNLAALAGAAKTDGVRILDLRCAPGRLPVLAFDPATGELRCFGKAAVPSAVFLRPDVFTQDASPTYHAHVAALLTLLRGWVAANPEISAFNRDPFGRSLSVNKGAALAAAAHHGLQIPETLLTNDGGALSTWADQGAELIQKPAGGGDLCRALTPDAVKTGRELPPVIAQARVAGPDLRVFRVGKAFLSFTLHSDHLDYRDDPTPQVTPCKAPLETLNALRRLTDAMGLTWCASDFKLDPTRGPVYLETNANPMFAAFDRAANGALCREMIAALRALP
jgi:hypothetical protein